MPSRLRLDASTSGSNPDDQCVQGRSMVISTAGVVASEHPLASQAGAFILARGGHAVDAAIAANAVMGVVAPMANGIGGDLFAIVYDAAADTVHGINASGWSPAALSIPRLRASGVTSMPQHGIQSVTVPGAVAGWARLRDRFGRLPLSALLGPAIQLAASGFPVSEIAAAAWNACESLLSRDEEASRVYLPGGRAPRTGEVFRNPDLADSYRQIAASGRDAFYQGEIGRRIAACFSHHGGSLLGEDLAAYDAEWVAPLTTNYRGWQVYELPPNGQGIAALMMLNLMEQAPMAEYGHHSAAALHTIIEAKKLAYADLACHVADPAFCHIPVDTLLSKAYARRRFAALDPAHASSGAAPGLLSSEGGDTTYLCAADRHGNLVSLIQSNYMGFGSGLVAHGTGFALQNRGALFTMDVDHPNAAAPRKRPLHTIIPALMRRGHEHIAFGIMGGWNQAQAHAQFVSNVVDHGLNIQAALDAARITKLTFGGRDVMVESGIAPSVRLALAQKGHELERLAGLSPLTGGGQAVRRDAAAGVNYGASDPRKDGAAIPEPPWTDDTR